MGASALEFTILTACRSGEVRGAVWSEFDLDGCVWVIPGTRMKAKKEHRVPLSKAAMKVLARMQAERRGDLVFPGRDEGKPISDMTMTAVLRRMNRGDLTTHGFRSTFRDWVSESTAYPRDVAEMALAHTIGDKVEAAYRRGDLFAKRVRMMDEWAKYCATVQSDTANVVPLKKGKTAA
jgi:integrase